MPLALSWITRYSSQREAVVATIVARIVITAVLAHLTFHLVLSPFQAQQPYSTPTRRFQRHQISPGWTQMLMVSHLERLSRCQRFVSIARKRVDVSMD